MPRKKAYRPKGKTYLLHAGVDKEKEYILNWMRNEYDNVSEGIWAALINHVETIDKLKRRPLSLINLNLVKEWGAE